jgi:NodT family efflux transporter outer membrane factor (OMF) lipoprotein
MTSDTWLKALSDTTGQTSMSYRYSGALAAVLFPALLAGCASAPSLPPRSTLSAGTGVESDALPARWWRLYGDPALDAQVEEALANNRDLRAASAHLLAAQAMQSEARSATLPTTSLSAGAGEGSTLQDQIAAADGRPVRTGPRLDLGGDVAWELDLFGRLRATVRAARADTAATAAETDAVRVLIVADVTGAWLRACGYAVQTDLARRALALAQAERDLAARSLAAGMGLPADVLRADAVVAQTRAMIAPLDARRHGALVELAVLSGHMPSDIPAAATACTRLPVMTAILPVGDGAALLRRRPDVRAAEQRLAASTARIGIAVADLYPRISLDGGAALSSPSVAGLGAPDNMIWRLGPLLSWSFPNISVARARIRQARAGEAEALARFDAAILKALAEVNRAGASYGAALARQQDLRLAAGLRADLAHLAQLERAGGTASAQDVVEAQRGDVAAQTDLAVAGSDVAAAQVALFKALGGGWEAEPAALSASTRSTPIPALATARK